MLVETMTPGELSLEIFAELKVLDITKERLTLEYDRGGDGLKWGRKRPT